MDVELERSLIKQSQKDPEAFGQLFDEYYPQIYAFILKRTGSQETAKDLTSETFFQALKNIWRYKITNKPFRAWLYRIAVVQIAQYYRNKEKYCEVTLENSPELVAHVNYNSDTSLRETEDKADEKEVFKHVHSLLLKLNETQHTVIVLKYFQNKKIKEIAKILDMKENTVKSHLRRGVKRLEQLLNQSNDYLPFFGYVKEKLSLRRRTVAERS